MHCVVGRFSFMELQLTHWPLASALFAVLLALGELLAPARRNARLRQRLRAFVLLALALIIAHGTLLVSGSIVAYPWFFGWQSPGGYAMAPLLFYYVRLSLDPADDALRRPRTWLIALAPAAGVAAYALWQAIVRPYDRAERIAVFYSGGGVEYWIILVGFAYFFVYMLAAGFVVLRRLTPPVGPTRPGLAAALGAAAIAALGFVAMVSGLKPLLQWTLYGMAAFVPAVYLLARWSPDFLAAWLEKVDRRAAGGPAESRLGSVDLPQLSARLDELMQRDRYYANEELSLADLARAAKVTSHQLSEFLNQKRGTSFFHYVNGLRVQEACRLLRDEPERTILSIAYEVGFNSKSAFHRAFSRHIGLSPREFRRKK